MNGDRGKPPMPLRMGGSERIRPYYFIKEYTMPDAIEMLREDQ